MSAPKQMLPQQGNPPPSAQWPKPPRGDVNPFPKENLGQHRDTNLLRRIPLLPACPGDNSTCDATHGNGRVQRKAPPQKWQPYQMCGGMVRRLIRQRGVEQHRAAGRSGKRPRLARPMRHCETAMTPLAKDNAGINMACASLGQTSVGSAWSAGRRPKIGDSLVVVDEISGNRKIKLQPERQSRRSGSAVKWRLAAPLRSR